MKTFENIRKLSENIQKLTQNIQKYSKILHPPAHLIDLAPLKRRGGLLRDKKSIKNTKHEILNSKQIQMTNLATAWPTPRREYEIQNKKLNANSFGRVQDKWHEFFRHGLLQIDADLDSREKTQQTSAVAKATADRLRHEEKLATNSHKWTQIDSDYRHKATDCFWVFNVGFGG